MQKAFHDFGVHSATIQLEWKESEGAGESSSILYPCLTNACCGESSCGDRKCCISAAAAASAAKRESGIDDDVAAAAIRFEWNRCEATNTAERMAPRSIDRVVAMTNYGFEDKTKL